MRLDAPSNSDAFVISLCHAVESGDIDTVPRIVESNPNLTSSTIPTVQRRARLGPVHFAAREGHRQIVTLLISAGANPLQGFFHNFPVPSALTLARDAGHFEIVDAIETHIARLIDAQPSALKDQDEDGNTPLHLAVYHRHRSLVGSLLRQGAEVDVRNKMGQRPIHLALYNGMGGPGKMLRDPYLDVAGILLDHGAEIDLWVASGLGDAAIVQRMAEENPEAVNADNGARRYPGGANYPLGIAAHGGHLEVVRILLEHGANPDIENDNEFRENDQLESGVPLVFAIA